MLLSRAALAALMVLSAMLNACAAVRSPAPPRIALLAAFEGRYRAAGYDALYAARLALADGGIAVDLLPVDDGGSAQTAADRAAALADDPDTIIVLLVGQAAAQHEVQHALGDLPALIVGNAAASSVRDRVFQLSNRALPTRITLSPTADIVQAASAPAPFVADERLALPGFSALRPDLEGVTIVSAAALPTLDYTNRIQASDPFAPPPGLLSMLVYDAVRIAIPAAYSADRAQAARMLAATQYFGLNGRIRFSDGWWADAPLYTYQYTERGELIAVRP
ncbi:MAG: hypothetical protein SF162_04185 [bacterium]|nr:hypothetical protein [bacterium]